MDRAACSIVSTALAVFVLSCGNGAPGQDLPGVTEEGVQKFAVSLRGEDIGYMELTVDKVSEGSLLVTQRTTWDLLLMGNRKQIDMSLMARADTGLNMRRLDFVLSDGSATIRTSTVRSGGDLSTVIESSGRESSMSSSFEGDYLPAILDLACARMSWREGQVRTFPAFDPATGTVSGAEVNCVGFEPQEFLGDTVRTTVLQISHLGTITKMWAHGGQIVREEESGYGLRMERVPPGQTGDARSTSDLYEMFAVRSDPIENPRELGTRTYRLEGEIDWDRFVLDYPPVQSTEGIEVTITTGLPRETVPLPVENTEMSPYLRPEPLIQSDDRAVMRLADSLTAGVEDSWEAALRINGYVDRAVINSPTVSLPSAVEVLENMRGDCNEHTILFVALARAAGIPAEVCAGVVYLDRAFGYHAWPMVWVGEWVPMDPTLGQPVADPTHIILAQGSLESQYVIASAMGRLSIKVVR
ncbi:hypothetical protein GF402_08680 [Candidatus Fermentibacteria bacterium]|nr:hypothetical protein [Candidatus Fermentibacteria bacterium]